MRAQDSRQSALASSQRGSSAPRQSQARWQTAMEIGAESRQAGVGVTR